MKKEAQAKAEQKYIKYIKSVLLVYKDIIRPQFKKENIDRLSFHFNVVVDNLEFTEQEIFALLVMKYTTMTPTYKMTTSFAKALPKLTPQRKKKYFNEKI